MLRTDTSLFRVDKFTVPAAARDGFLSAARAVQAVVGAQPGCVQNHMLELASGDSVFNFVTMVEWASAEHMERARHAVAALHAREGIDVQVFRAANGIVADSGVYHHVPGMLALRAVAA